MPVIYLNFKSYFTSNVFKYSSFDLVILFIDNSSVLDLPNNFNLNIFNNKTFSKRTNSDEDDCLIA